VRRVAEKVRQFFPDVQIQHTEKRPGDLRPKVVSSRKALAELGWKPEITFEEGAERYIKWAEQSAPPGARTPR
jgi:nucleoside-diphosphate-sugar epimerase